MARYGCTIEVDTGKIPSSQSNFAWLATEDNFPTAAIDGGGTSILNGGGNLRCYTDSTKATQLPIEVVSFVTGGTPSVQVWGLSPTLGVGGTVYIEADDVAVTQPAVGAAFGRNAVWVDSLAVYHGDSVVDSTGNGQDLVVEGSPSIVSGGQIGDSYNTSGVNNTAGNVYIGTLNTGVIDVSISSWVKRADTDYASAISIANSTTPAANAPNYISTSSSGSTFYTAHRGTTGGFKSVSTTGFSTNTWQMVNSSYLSSTRNLSVKLNDGATVEAVQAVTSPLDFNYVIIGRENNNSGSDLFAWNGQEDNINVRGVGNFPSDNRITSEYNNQSSSSTFWTTGAWEDQDAGGITVTPQTINSLSVSLDPVIQFNSVVNVSPLSLDSSSVALNPAITFSSALNVSPNTINSLSVSLDPTIQFSSVLDVTPNVINSSSVALNPAIEFTSALIIAPQTINSASISLDPLVEFKSVINLTPDAINSLSISLNPTITTGQVQTIGSVTAGFADDLYSVKYKLSGITVNFKE